MSAKSNNTGKKLTAKTLRAAMPHIFLADWEAKEFIRTKLKGGESLDEAITAATEWNKNIKKQVEAAFANENNDFW